MRESSIRKYDFMILSIWITSYYFAEPLPWDFVTMAGGGRL
jgi:hypothetical protein